MVALKGAGIESFLRKPDRNIKAALIYGPDSGLVIEQAKRLVRSRVDDLDDPFNVVRIEDNILSGDPGLLADEARSQSLMGGDRVVWIRNGGTGLAGALDAYLKDPIGDALIVAEAGELKPAARLRKVAEASKHAVAIACYADNARSIEDLVDSELKTHNLQITPDARQMLTSLLGADRQLTRREIEKLVLYVNGKQSIEADDVEAICGDATATTLDSIIDAAADGRVRDFDSSFQAAIASGTNAGGILLACSRHMTRLQALALANTGNADTAIRSARPPIHFSRQNSIKKQLRLWSAPELNRVIGYLANTEAESRLHGELSEVLVARALMSIARKANGLGQRR